MENKTKKITAGLFFILLLLVIIVFCIGIFLDKRASKEEAKEKIENQEIHIGQKISNGKVLNEAGEEVLLEGSQGKPYALVFWASWCPHCEEGMEQAKPVVAFLKEQGIPVFFLNKLDGTKETKEQAIAFWKAKEMPGEILFDEGCKIYEEMGLRMIPTTLVVNATGEVTSLLQGTVFYKEQAEAMFLEANKGKSVFLAEAIEKTLLHTDGGMYTNYQQRMEGTLPTGEDVLSESQGILLEYASLVENEELFDKTYAYTKQQYSQVGLMPWVMNREEETNVNALIDDLRIAGALGQKKLLKDAYIDYRNNIYEYNTSEGKLVDFYDWNSQEKANRFTLCYADFKTLSQMKQEDKRYEEVYQNALELVQKGQISEKFPLYYSYYDYAEQRYQGNEFHMAEALTTLLHLSEIKELPEDAWKWLEEKLEEGILYSIYQKDGTPSKEGYYESTAVYAIAARIAMQEGRMDLAQKTITRMEEFRVMDSQKEWSGLFGNVDGTGVYSFDQGMALLAYEQYERMSQ